MRTRKKTSGGYLTSTYPHPPKHCERSNLVFFQRRQGRYGKTLAKLVLYVRRSRLSERKSVGPDS